MEIHAASPRVFVFRRRAAGFWVSATLVTTRNFDLVVDTLVGPRDMETVLHFLAARHNCRTGSRPLFVINTHHHWDHIWGNCSFPGTPILAHRLCRDLAAREAAADLGAYGGQVADAGPVEIVLPNVLLNNEAVLDGGDIGIHIRPAPGHTPDSLVVHLPDEGILIAGDTLEYPLPLLEWPGHATDYLDTLSRMADWRICTVIPGHGPATCGRELIFANARYVQNLMDFVHEALARGCPVERLPEAVPLRLCLDETVDPTGWGYEGLHRENVVRYSSEYQL